MQIMVLGQKQLFGVYPVGHWLKDPKFFWVKIQVVRSANWKEVSPPAGWTQLPKLALTQVITTNDTPHDSFKQTRSNNWS